MTVKTQPSSPTQTCVVGNGTGTVASANVINIAVTCSSNTYAITVTVSGIAERNEDSLIISYTDDSAAPGFQWSIGSDPFFKFSTQGTRLQNEALRSGASYSLIVVHQPGVQTCVVANGSGTVASANVNITVTCSTNTYAITAAVSGLVGSGLILQNNGANDLSFTTNGTFTISSAASSGSAYGVTVKTQPSSPTQTCVVGNGTGTVASANVVVSVTCTTGLPIITAHPASKSIYEAQSASFSVTASDVNSAIRFQWTKNGSNIPGATSSSYTLTAATLSDNAATIAVAVTGEGGTATSVAAVLTVLPAAPSIATAPSAQSAISGGSVTFYVTAAGLPPYAYQWLKNGAVITGANSATYTEPTTVSDSGKLYSVTVTNSIGSVISATARLTVTASALADLKISEVSYCYLTSVSCWFEIYNPTASSVNLNGYSVKSSTCTISNCSAYGSSTFTLPSFTLAPGAYVILSGNTSQLTDTSLQNILLLNGTTVPSWKGSFGFIEILKAGATVDYVALSTPTTNPSGPTTAAGWTGENVSLMPVGAGTTYGTSIVRPYPRTADTDTNSASDWILVNYVTPAGRNDIGSDSADADDDGIPDSAETAGGTLGGLDLYAMGARENQKDIFIEVDQMVSSDLRLIPRREALQKVVEAFSARNIKVHFDAGNAFALAFSPADFSLGQGSNVVPYEKCVSMDASTCTQNSTFRKTVYDWKNDYMDLRRRSVFHYLLFGSTQNADGTSGPSGRAELPGNDIVVTLGEFSGLTSALLINYQAATVMHELGHNLNLHHGGDEELNYKPNYFSIMNYTYQLSGLEPDPKSMTAYQRWRVGGPGGGGLDRCALVASPCGDPANFLISYSDGSGGALNEMSLLESENIGRGINVGAYADWNLSGSLTVAPQQIDLSADNQKTVLHDYNDWANIRLSSRSVDSNSGASLARSNDSLLWPISRLYDPISNDRQPVAEEYPIFNQTNDAPIH